MVGGRARDEAKSNNVMLPPPSLFPALISNLDNKRSPDPRQAKKRRESAQIRRSVFSDGLTETERERERAV